MPLTMSDLSLCFISALTSILVVQLLKLGDFGAETSYLFTKHCEVIHNF
jgi:hypothetical protein